MKIFLIFLIVFVSIDHLKAQVCSTNYDPYIITFDGMRYGFQYSGDHYIMYDDFKNTRVTSGFQKCSRGSCNCAVYVQKNRKLMFVDFCNVKSNTSPTSKIYAVSVEQNHVGPKAIREVLSCPVISSLHENNKATWDLVPTILGSFKCARLQGSSHYTYHLIRTVENHFEDSVLVKFQLANRAMPTLSIRAPSSAYRSSGGLCGRWDGSRNTDLYVLDRHGVESFLTTSSLSTIGNFWNLNSVYNKPNYTKRCPECMLMSERSFYCPCDDFNLFDQNNYNLPPNRLNYCKVPMYACVERHFNFINPNPTTTSSYYSTTTFPSGSLNNVSTTRPWSNSSDLYTTTEGAWTDFSTESNQTLVTPTIATTLKPISPEQAFNICWTGFMNHPGLKHVLNNECLDQNITIQFCIDDITLTGDVSFLNIHIESSIDITIQNILTNQSNCDLNDLQLLCPNGCSENGVCNFNPLCLMPGIITADCMNPIQCECNAPYGGADCSLDLTNITEFTVNPQFCDLRNENCTLVNGFGYPFSTRDPIYVKVEYSEYDIYDRAHLVTETSIAETLTDNNILINLQRLSSLNLYKNIHSIRTNFDSRDTLAHARIYISYSNVSFVQWANMTLYDSMCRTEDEENGVLVFLDDRCDIQGFCYIRNETNPTNTNFYCNPDESIDSWTPVPDPLCNGESAWSEWFNYDSPLTGEGDLELCNEHQYGCKYPSNIQIRTVSGVPVNETGQVTWLVPLYGFFCFNKENKDGCFDYEIRQCCLKNELITTRTSTHISTTTQTEFTTEWTEVYQTEELFESTNSTTTSTTSQTEFTTEWTEVYQTEELFESTNSTTTSTKPIEELTTQSELLEFTSFSSLTNCHYSINFNFKDNIASFPEFSGNNFLRIDLKNENSWCNDPQFVELEIFPESVTAYLNQDFNASNDTILLNNNISNGYNLTILDDSLIEPFEFFVLRIKVVSSSIPLERLTVPEIVYVYIQDDDYKNGQRVEKIFNIFEPEIAESDLFSAFYTDAALTNLYQVNNNQALFTDQGGFSIPLSSINIVVENSGIFSYKIHTVEINNPQFCNIDSFTIRRKKFLDVEYLDPYEIKSFYLNGVAFVDIDFNKFANNLGSRGDDFQRMDIRVLSTKDGLNINNCEFRAFAEEN